MLLTFLLLEPDAGDMGGLALYLLAGSLVSVGLTEVLVRDNRVFGAMRLRPRLVIAFVFVTALGLLNIFALSAFMFVNTGHDLPMLLAFLVFAGGVSVYVAYRLAEGVSGALERLAEGVKSVATGEFSTRVPEGAADEIGDVSKAFNQMAARLEEAQRRQSQLEDERKQFTAALSHDLRTPLSSARVMLEAIRDGVISDSQEQREYVRRTLVEVRNLSDLVDDLFELSLLDAGALKLHMSPTPLQELVLSSVEGMSAAAKSKGLAFDVQVDEACGDVVMDGLRVRRVLMNLVQNAIRHTPADGSVTVAAHDEGDQVTVEVRDTGEGISADDLPKIWTRSYRADPSRTRDINGLQQTGLGLATAKAIIELHGGWVSATSALGEGSSFVFGLPKKAAGAGV
jgi:two-component system sensor histidine kinase BaeS